MIIGRGREAKLPDADIDWDSIATDMVRKLAARWPQLDTATIQSAVDLACALVAQRLRNAEQTANVEGLVWTISHLTLDKENRVRKKVVEVSYDAERENGGLLEWEKQKTPPFEETLFRDKALWSAIDSLDDKYRIPLIEHIVNGKSYQEIEVITHIKSATARNNVARAKRMVRAEMERQNHLS